MAKEDAEIVMKFKNTTISHLKDVMVALPAIIPQTKEDEELMRDGMKTIDRLIYNLEKCETIRELAEFIDVQRVANDFDMESISTLDSRINNTVRATSAKLSETIRNMRGEYD